MVITINAPAGGDPCLEGSWQSRLPRLQAQGTRQAAGDPCLGVLLAPLGREAGHQTPADPLGLEAGRQALASAPGSEAGWQPLPVPLARRHGGSFPPGKGPQLGH